MNLLDLPPEILRLIVQHCYEPWAIRVHGLHDAPGRLKIEGVPSGSLLRICRPLHELAKEMEVRSFTGHLHLEEKSPGFRLTSESPRIGLTYESFVGSRNRGLKPGPRLDWVRKNVRTIRFTNPGINPANWKFHRHLHHFKEFPNLKTIELDCRWPWHFAVHNVDSAEDFLCRREGRLDREMDYRHSFFLSCERFLHLCVCDGIAVTVIRAMGLREGNKKCQAVVSLLSGTCQSLLILFDRSLP